MKFIFGLFMAVVLSLQGFSCSSVNKETCTEQTEKAEKMPEAKKTSDNKDTLALTLTNLLKTGSADADTVNGIIYITGNEPFTQIAIRISDDTSFIIEADSSIKARLRQLQGRHVCIIGEKKSSLKRINISVSKFYTTE